MNSDPAFSKALEHFKDWSNYLLITTVAALGWVSTGGDMFWFFKAICILLLGGSIVFGIATLALIPLVAEQFSRDQHKSIYDVDVEYNKVRLGKYLLTSLSLEHEGKPKKMKLKQVCWRQHVTFLLAIAFYAIGAL